MNKILLLFFSSVCIIIFKSISLSHEANFNLLNCAYLTKAKQTRQQMEFKFIANFKNQY